MTEPLSQCSAAHADRQPAYASLLSGDPPGQHAAYDRPDQAVVSDLNLDQVVTAVAGKREERDRAATRFSEQVRQVRVHLNQLPKMYSARQREGWFLDAAAIYCDSTLVRSVGLARLMMQCGMFVTARLLRSSACAQVFTHFIREEDPGMVSRRLDEENSGG